MISAALLLNQTLSGMLVNEDSSRVVKHIFNHRLSKIHRRESIVKLPRKSFKFSRPNNFF